MNTAKSQAPRRGRGRPSLGDYRLQAVLPQAVLDELKKREAATGVYHTRVAARVLCEWASKESGRYISPNSR
jgi:hypothetical protein